MDTGTSDHQIPQLRILSEEQCRELFIASLECLQDIGVIVHNQEARQLLENAGAKSDKNLVKIPQNIIKQALVWAPTSFKLWD